MRIAAVSPPGGNDVRKRCAREQRERKRVGRQNLETPCSGDDEVRPKRSRTLRAVAETDAEIRDWALKAARMGRERRGDAGRFGS